MIIHIKEAYTDRVPLRSIVIAPKIRPTKPVSVINEELFFEVKLALKACLAYDGVGISANQIGLKQSFFLIREDENNFKVYFNPKHKVLTTETQTQKEGCLSVPGYNLMVPRPLEIKAFWQEIENGEFVDKEEVRSGMDARVFLHELDHLNGSSIIDRSSELNRAGKREMLKNLNQL